MLVFQFDKREDKADTESVFPIIKKIQGGDIDLREKFIGDNISYVIRTVSNILGRVVDNKNSEEYSVGLSAFNEAIDRYDLKRNDSFHQYSFLVIKSRLIDYIRKNHKHSRVLPFSHVEETVRLEDRFLACDLSRQFESIEIRQGLISFETNLKQFGITLNDLVLSSPKHKDSRILLIRIAKIIADNDEMFEILTLKKYIPVKELLKNIKVNKKTIQRNRKFIIAVSLILRSNLYDLKEYIWGFEKEGKYE